MNQDSNKTPESRRPPKPGQADWIPFGYIARAHGVRGELRLETFSPDSEIPASAKFLCVYPRGGEISEGTVHSIKTMRETNAAILLTLSDIADRNAAGALKGYQVAVLQGDVPQPAEGEFYLYELVGGKVRDADDNDLGEVLGFIDNAAHDVMRVEFEGKERLLPVVAETVLGFDRDSKVITVAVPEGLWAE